MQRKIDLILTKSLSRFARNTVDSLNYIRELKSLGIAEIVPDEAEIVREIYRQYLDGASLNQIAQTLNNRVLTTKGSNSPYRKEGVQRILTNEKYTGDALLQKTFMTECITKKITANCRCIWSRTITSR